MPYIRLEVTLPFQPTPEVKAHSVTPRVLALLAVYLFCKSSPCYFGGQICILITAWMFAHCTVSITNLVMFTSY